MSVLSDDIKRSILQLTDTGFEAFEYIMSELAKGQNDSTFKMLTNVFEMCAEVEKVLCTYCVEDVKLSNLTDNLKQGFREALGYYEKRDIESTKVLIENVLFPGYLLWKEQLTEEINAR